MPRPVDPDRLAALTFDCYGTLIDWLGGVRAAVSSIAALEGCDVERLLAEREDTEAAIEAGAFQTYDRVLAQSLQRAATRQGCAVSDEEAAAFADSVGDWIPFADSREMLRRLATRYQLAILSNIQPDVLARSIDHLGAPFAVTVTAGEIGSYKPARPHFDEGLRRLGLPKERVLHCANSLYHDIRPALELEWNAAWVNREGKSPPPGVEPHLVVPDLERLVAALGC
jgi:2-haloalkanoic acid dehalogenase type II